MKYLRYSFLLVLMLAFTNFTIAQESEKPAMNTVIEVSQMEENSKVMLEGYITNQTGDDEYTFKDETGEIIIEVDEDTWRVQNVNEDIKVQILGVYKDETDREMIMVQKLKIIDL